MNGFRQEDSQVAGHDEVCTNIVKTEVSLSCGSPGEASRVGRIKESQNAGRTGQNTRGGKPGSRLGTKCRRSILGQWGKKMG